VAGALLGGIAVAAMIGFLMFRVSVLKSSTSAPHRVLAVFQSSSVPSLPC
jgi:hypothetical protein